MEKILVGIDGHHSAWEALTRACALAKRIDAQLYVLLVQPLAGGGSASGRQSEGLDLRKHLELRIEMAKSEGIPVHYYIAEGQFEEEIVRFVNHYRITLLVYELRDGAFKATEKEAVSLQAIRHRIACQVEIVAARKHLSQTQEKIS